MTRRQNRAEVDRLLRAKIRELEAPGAVFRGEPLRGRHEVRGAIQAVGLDAGMLLDALELEAGRCPNCGRMLSRIEEQLRDGHGRPLPFAPHVVLICSRRAPAPSTSDCWTGIELDPSRRAASIAERRAALAVGS